MSETVHVLPSSSEPELTAEVEGLRLWLSPRARVERGDGRPGFIVEGRASVELQAVAAWVPDDAFGRARLTGPSRFELEVREPSELSTLASGLPVFLTVTPAAAAAPTPHGRAEAAIWLSPWLTVEGVEGSDGGQGGDGAALEVRGEVRPVWVAGEVDDEGRPIGEVQYRGEARASSGPAPRLGAATAPPPTVAPLDGGRLRLAFSTEALLAALAAPPPSLTLTLTRRGEDAAACGADGAPPGAPDGATSSTAVHLELRATRLELTRADPREVWPSSCAPAVLACLGALPSADADTEGCGSYRQVLACARSGAWPAPR